MGQGKEIIGKGIYAGFLIGLGGMVYLSAENRVVGACLFSFGLLTIVAQGFYLYTGKIGFLQSWRELGEMGLILPGNFLGRCWRPCCAGRRP